MTFFTSLNDTVNKKINQSRGEKKYHLIK